MLSHLHIKILSTSADIAQRDMEEMVRQKDREIALKENAIQEMKTKMDEMAKEFGQMLKVDFLFPPPRIENAPHAPQTLNLAYPCSLG